MSTFELCRWSQNCAQLLDYVDFKSLHSDGEVPKFQSCALPQELPCQTAESTACLPVLVMAFLAPCTPWCFFCGSGSGHCYSWLCTCPHQPVPCKLLVPGRPQNSFGFSLTWEPLGNPHSTLGKPPCSTRNMPGVRLIFFSE